ncbi:VaFE repeat-containing surface-anchored protein [Anthropogastromicrobium sp.]|uniref:VaFE repeat-containing surface-anchored protein n=1 Tax=Anthropogastromicrobium sp. TaxID=2981649 RepID=UPI0030794F45
MTGGKDGSSEITTEKKEERMQPKARQKRESGVQRKDMTMSPKNKKGKKLTSTIMALAMTVTTTFQMPTISMASEMESSVAIESQIEEGTSEESVSVQSETTAQTSAEQTNSVIEETSGTTEATNDATQVSDEVQAITEETTAETDQPETESSVAEEVQSSGESAEETSANETRGPDETQENETTAESESETEAQTDAASEEETEASTEEALIDLSTATKDEILAYIEAIGGAESDAYYGFLSGLGEDEYQLVWIAQFGSEEDVIASTFDFDYDNASDLEIAKYVHKLTEDELYNLIESMTFEQYRRYLSIKEMMAEMDEKDFADVVDEEEFTADRTWDYESYDAFAEAMTGVSLQRTEQVMQFYNTYVEPSKVQAGVTTIDGLLDSGADWYSNDYILSLNPEMAKETVPIYHGSDGNFYVVSTVPMLNGTEAADYQSATSFYNGSIEAQAFTDIEYLGNGVYRIPDERYKYCFTEQYLSDMGTLYGITFGLRIQVLYGYTPSGTVKIAADVVYPDMTERFLPATLDLLSGVATVRIFNDDYDDSVDNYLVSASVNRGASLPESMSSLDGGKTVQFAIGDASAVGSLDVLIGYNATSKYSMNAEVTTTDLYPVEQSDSNISLTAELYNNMYVKVDRSCVPKDLAVGDKFVYPYTTVTVVGNETVKDQNGGEHLSASAVPTHDAQSFCFYTNKGVDAVVSSWFKTQLTTNSPDPGVCMVQMTAENIAARTNVNGISGYLAGRRIFGYLSNALYSSTNAAGKTLNLDGTRILLACMHAWANEGSTAPTDVVNSVSAFTERTQKDWAAPNNQGQYTPNIALQCTDVHDGGDGFTYATFKVATSMLQVGGVYQTNRENYQCSFATLRIIYPSAPQTGFLQIHKSSADPAITNGNSCYNFEGIPYGIFTDAECRNPVTVVKLDANGYSQPYELTAGTYYVREAEAKPGSGFQTNSTVYTIEVSAGTTATAPVMCETTDVPLNDPLGIVINKINADGTTTSDLSGAEYTIKYYPKQYNTVAEIQADSEAKATTWVIKTVKSASGYFASLDDAHIVSDVSDSAKFGKTNAGRYIIPLGTITVEETKAPTGFTKEGAVVSSAATGATLTGTNNVYLFNLVDKDSAIYLKSGNVLDTAATDETAITLQYAERQINGTPKMEKHDLELNKKAAMGGTNFAGITFEVYCLDDSVIIGNTTYKKGETIETVTSDAEGNVTMTTQYPIGHYAVREKSANNYYTNDGQIHYFNVVEYQGGAFIQYETNMNAVTFTDRVVRGDLSFVKKNSDTGEALAYIPFCITNNATGETHYILTDANGNFTSATGKTTNTNANDDVLSKYGEKDVVPQSVIDSLAKDAGLWFGMGSEGTMTAANDSYGAFVYGTYTITELKTEATRSMKMYTNTFTIDTDGKVLDLGTVDNIPMSIRTTLVDVNEEHFTEVASSITLTDHVAYKNLDTDKTYTLTGTLYIKDVEALTELMTQTVDFTPVEKNGTQDIVFTFDASDLAGKSVVAFEELSVNGEFCAEHKDKDDENQTVTFPSIQTTARDSKTEDHVANATDSVSIIDTVTYSGLKVGETYTITGTLMDADTGKAVLDDDGNEITASKEFVAPAKDGSVDITFNFAGVSLAGKKIVAFEEVCYKGRRYAVHADLSDEGQTVYVPKIRTKALDANTRLNQVKADSNATVVDTVTYENLLPGKKYTMKGVLMTSAGNALMVNGRTITASTEFTPTTPNGSVDVTFNFDASEIGGRKLVFYEYLELDGDTVASHTDISDTDQTIYVPSIKTTIIDSENGSHNAAADEEITLIDTVRYNGLEVGRKYSVTGTLVDKETGKALLDDAGKEITASNEFTAEKPNGTIEITFKFSGVSLAGKTTVAFEHMYTDGKEVAVHADLKDEKQTQYLPSVHTTATSNDTQDHVTGSNEKVTITDLVSMKALKIGTEYTVSGTLMNAATGKPVLVDGKTITSRRTFTADSHDMTVSLTYTLNASELAGTTTVVFENLYSDGALLAVHADTKDAEQTVYIPEIHTTAKDQTTQINHTEAKKQATIVDTVSYTNLLPGKEYTVSGTLMDKETGKAVLADGKEITASTTFTPEKSEGSVDVVFTFDASVVAPKTVVAFETLTYKKIQIAVHADIEDKDQTVYIPKVHTTAIADDTKDHVTEAKKDVTIVDTVSYEGLEVDREYTVKGVLMNKATGKAILVDDKEVTASATFTPEEKNGTVDVTFTFDGSALEDTLIVVFETLYTEGKEVGIHADIDDDAQTVYIPKIQTEAKDAVTEIDHTEALPKAKIIDTVSYSSLLPGKEYTVTGTLMNKETKEPVLIDGEKVTASTTFTAEKAEGSVEVVFEFDASAIAGTTVVAFESMEYKGIEVAVHADIEDENQTVYIPDVHTTATATDTEDHVTGANEEVTITDEVALTGLKVGNEYTVRGVLMDRNTGAEIQVGGESITDEKTFTAETADMTVTLTYTLDASKLAGTTTVVFETLYTAVTEEMGVEVGRHHDLTDEGQTVYIPEIHTTAADQKTEINHTKSEETATIIDTVHYSHLLPGKEYTVKGVLMNKETGEEVLIDDKPITAETTFTPEKSEGSVDVIFTFDSSLVAPKTVVAFETLEYKGIEIAVHADIEDKDQTVYVPKIKTTAIGEDTEDHIEKAKEDAVIVDTVEYKGLEIGREYTMTGKLVDKVTGEVITDAEGNEITVSETFTAEEKDGSIDITFKFDASALAGKSLVAFESLTAEGKEVAVHADLEDEGQTVRIPEIKTTATDKVTGDHDGVVAKETTVLDEVFYKNLIPGKEYTVKGTLMVKETGEPLTIDGKEVTAEKTFTAEEEDGSIVLEFTFDSSALAGKHIVAFEDVEYKGISIGSHEDLEDEDQTISYPSIHTTATDQASGSKTMALGSSVTLVDTVTYTGLTVGKTYVVKGTIMDKASGQSIGVTAETTFTAEAADGSTTVAFTFDTSVLQGKTLVVFETLYDTNGNQIVAHSDLNDEDQTVTVPVQPENPPVITGDDSTPMPYVAGLAAALLAIAVIVAALVVKRRRKQA